MHLTHNEARRAMQLAADGLLSAEGRLALEAHLQACAACRQEAEALAALEEHLAASLQARWPRQDQPSPAAAFLLGQDSTPRRLVMPSSSTPLARSLAFSVAAIVFVIVVGLGLRAFTPRLTTSSNVTSTLPAVPLTYPPATSHTATPAPSRPTALRYIVEQGDTCVHIAAMFNVPVESIIALNQLSADCQIQVGQTLQIPQPLPASPTLPPQPTPASSLPQPAGIFPHLTFVADLTLPPAPPQVMLYRQQVADIVTAQSAQQAAASLGIAGIPTPLAAEGFDQTLFEVSDSFALLRFLNFPNQWVYESLTGDHRLIGDMLPFEQQVSIAEAFLNAHSLLDAPYRVEPIENQPGGVRFVRLLEGRPVLYGIGINGDLAWIEVTVSSQGEVSRVMYSAHDFQPVGDYPILSAAQAWERFTGEQGVGKTVYAIFPPEQPARIWERSYPLGQEMEFYGLFHPADAEGRLRFSLWGSSQAWSLSGNLEGIESQASGYKPWVLTRVWGQLSEVNGEITLNVSRWEEATAAEGAHSYGKLQRQGGQSWLVTEQGQKFLLPALPETAADGALVNVNGVVVAGEPPVYEWSTIDTLIAAYGQSQSCFGGGGGGGGGPSNANFGGGAFALLALDGTTAASALSQPGSPLPPGERLAGLSGSVYVTIYTRQGVATRRQVDLWVEAGVLGADYTSLQLEGEALAGIEALHNLPIKIWGSVSRIADDGRPVVTVERFEEVYPGQRIQAWIGTEAVVTLEGQSAVLFTTQDGLQFVLEHTIGGDASYLVGRPGDLIIQEGLLIPNKTFGGYPVVMDMAASVQDNPDLNAYEITSNQPTVIDETWENGSLPASLYGVAIIENVELAYWTVSLDNCQPSHNETPMEAGLYVQPIWVFKGHLEDGRRFEIRSQALPDEYLQP